MAEIGEGWVHQELECQVDDFSRQVEYFENGKMLHGLCKAWI